VLIANFKKKNKLYQHAYLFPEIVLMDDDMTDDLGVEIDDEAERYDVADAEHHCDE
jgi:hypothetical protein